MSGDELELALRALAKRRPYRSILLEFHSGDRILVSHPEALARFGEVFLYRGTDGGQRLFSAYAISQVIDPPSSGTGHKTSTSPAL